MEVYIEEKKEPGCLMAILMLVMAVVKSAIEIFMMWQAVNMAIAGDIDRAMAYMAAWALVSLAHDYSSTRLMERYNL